MASLGHLAVGMVAARLYRNEVSSPRISPFDLTRYFTPWTPIPVSPIGRRFLSPRGMYTAGVELLYFAPLFWFALRRRGAAAASQGRD